MNGLTTVTFEGYVHTEDGTLVDGRGQRLLMRGVGLGNWLLPEGYMWGFPHEGPQSPREIEAFLVDLIGPDAAAAFWRGFRDRFISEADIRKIAAEGFDHVRLPMNARLLIDDAGGLETAGLALIDRLIGWCRQHGLWVVLDLHGAPGGQTGTNIDDSPRGLPDLFLVGGAYREQTIALWTQLAARYRDETVIAGFDLLNEPLPHEYAAEFGTDLASLYQDLTAAVRSVDAEHLLIYEGTRWSTDWSIFTDVWDPNSMLQFHKYWSAPDRPSIAAFIEKGETLSLPIYMGEGGENRPAWLQTAFGLYEDLGISWNLWPWKKMDTRTSPASVTPPPGWEKVVRHAARQGPRPAAAQAQRLLDDLLPRMEFDACQYRTEVVAAVFHRVPVRLTPEAFGFRGAGASYETRQPRPLDDFRSDDRVTLRRVGGSHSAITFEYSETTEQDAVAFEVVVGTGDWLEYSIQVPTPSRLAIEVATRQDDSRHRESPGLRIDGGVIESRFDDGHVRSASDRIVSAGPHLVRIEGRSPNTVIGAVSVVPTGEGEPVG